jgi:GxxExxY protein
VSTKDTKTLNIEEIAKLVIGAAIRVQSDLGPGLFESVYEQCLMYELQELGLSVKRQVPIPIKYQKMLIEDAFRADMLINDVLIIEIKATEKDSSLHLAQLLSYLKLGNYSLGLLLNFWRYPMKDGGIRRAINTRVA